VGFGQVRKPAQLPVLRERDKVWEAAFTCENMFAGADRRLPSKRG
jgi:hypothetical protein